MDEYIDREAALSLVKPDVPEDEKAAVTIAVAKKLIRSILNRATADGVAPVVHWIPTTEQLPESNHKNDHVGDVLCFVPPRDGCYQSGLYLGKPKHVAADDGSGNFWGRPMQASDWTLWGWIYLEKPVVTHWMPLPEPPKMDGGADNGKTDV